MLAGSVLAESALNAYISGSLKTSTYDMAEIFICYRRNDSEGYAGRLHDGLQERFGPRAVFVDVDNLHPGVDFEDVIQRTLLRSSIVLVVIGPRWLDQRLKNEADYVRREIIAALKGKKRVIPILVGDARMPARDRLPPELASLAGKNAVTLRHAAWRADVSRLITSLERTLGRKKAPAKPSSSPASKPKDKRLRSPRSKTGGPTPITDAVPKEKSAPKPRPPATKESQRTKSVDKAAPKPLAQRGKKEGGRQGATSTSKPTSQTQQAPRGNRSVRNDKAVPAGGKKTTSGKSARTSSPRPKPR